MEEVQETQGFNTNVKKTYVKLIQPGQVINKGGKPDVRHSGR